MPLLDQYDGLPLDRVANPKQQAGRVTNLQQALSPVQPVQSGLSDPAATSTQSLLTTLLNTMRNSQSALQQMTYQPVGTISLAAGGQPAAAAGGAAAGAAAAAGNPSKGFIVRSGKYATGNGNPVLRQQMMDIAARMGWQGGNASAWDGLINAESSWNPNAKNPTSTAFGLGQFLDSTWKSYGAKTGDPAAQLRYMAQYIKQRYGDPSRALAFHQSHNWY